ncbi:MAG TPA: hypothetical protein PLJ78_06630 [Anaerolineae bacterium]|nr:hypothetical protein [Anaerolineae bacterium]HQK13601.1 hypothetical protein [Anaerolineae bacterium]
MFYNPIELEVWKMRVLRAERQAMQNYQTRDLKSPETRMLERLLRGMRCLFTVRPLSNFRLMQYPASSK